MKTTDTATRSGVSQPSLTDELVAMEVLGRRRIELERELWSERQRLWQSFGCLIGQLDLALHHLNDRQLWLESNDQIADRMEGVLSAFGSLCAAMAHAVRDAPVRPPRSVADRAARALTGDQTLRSIMRLLGSTLFDRVANGDGNFSCVTQAGVEFGERGVVMLDRSAFLRALVADRDAVRLMLSRRGSTTADTGAMRRVQAVSRKLVGQRLFADLARNCAERVALASRELTSLDDRTSRRRAQSAAPAALTLEHPCRIGVRPYDVAARLRRAIACA